MNQKSFNDEKDKTALVGKLKKIEAIVLPDKRRSMETRGVVPCCKIKRRIMSLECSGVKQNHVQDRGLIPDVSIRVYAVSLKPDVFPLSNRKPLTICINFKLPCEDRNKFGGSFKMRFRFPIAPRIQFQIVDRKFAVVIVGENRVIFDLTTIFQQRL